MRHCHMCFVGRETLPGSPFVSSLFDSESRILSSHFLHLEKKLPSLHSKVLEPRECRMSQRKRRRVAMNMRKFSPKTEKEMLISDFNTSLQSNTSLWHAFFISRTLPSAWVHLLLFKLFCIMLRVLPIFFIQSAGFVLPDDVHREDG